MRTSGFLASLGSVLLVACGGSGDKGAQQGITPGIGGVMGVAGAAPITGAGGTTSGTPGTVPTQTPGGTVGGPPGAGGSTVVVPTGMGGAVVTPGPGGAPSGGAPSGGAPAGGAANGGAGGAAVTPDPPNTVSMHTDAFQVAPGEELYRCQNFDNPFGGKDTAVNRVVTDMSPGSHHLHVYNLTEGSSRTIEVCTTADFHALIHAAGSPHAESVYPDGMARKIKGNTGLRSQLHYINTGTDPINATSTLKMTPVADMSTVSKWVAELYFNRVQLQVPPGMGQTVTTTCSVPNSYGPITMIGGGTHMHKRGIKEVAMTSTGVMLANATTWDEPPPEVYNPPVVLNPGDSITWTCTYNNDTGMTLTFGESAATNEMCIYVGEYYSSSSNDTQIACQAPGPNGGTAQPQLY